MSTATRDQRLRPVATMNMAQLRRALGSRISHLLLAASAAWGLTLTTAGTVSAQRAIYDVTRVVGFAKTECTGHSVQNCVPVRSKLTTVRADEPSVIRLSCPQSHPHVVGWDARHHEHISSRVIGVGQARPGTSRVPPKSGDLQVAVRNEARRPGEARIVAGCSTQPYQGHPFMQSRGSIPSKHPGMRR